MNKKILIVEDEPFIREMYEKALATQGYLLDAAEDGEIALAKIRQQNNTYDLIILDIMLPKVDGISILKEIRSTPNIKDTPVFLLTNLGLDNVIKQATDLGAQKYFIKANFLPKDIVAQVNSFFQ